ncbi:beta-ketoacyl synthase N-terminal-like domain-containing protein [Xenophilus sp. Marseille-Q4582]|uniref:beta-ketoacyl synthase N-terminal-like domain-containing protein n=1 Tax=Xenophilus sp. Marseille-Q4582 TaxID=2866600 RepID=UPI001CE3C91E|nr:beta-ketoacyl synthase N-terminal-like domain-containing protein [Xenophilus sp. Marseille-Q4582]
MSAAPVFIAGRGLVSSLGWGWAPAKAALLQAPRPAARMTLADGQAWPLHALPPLAGTWQQRLAQAVRAVVAQAGVPARPGLPLFIGSSSLDMGHEEEQARHGGAAFAGDLCSLADAVAHALDWPGPVFCFSTACTSAAQALCAARDWLRAGESEHALVLGVEMDNGFTPAGFAGLQLLSPGRARPFAAQRDGLVPGQAVAALHLQTRPTRWRLAGAANVVDGSQPTGAVPQALEAAARQALAEAGCRAEQVDRIKVQAAGSPGNDAAEAQALRALFGTPAATPPLMGFKPWIGHCMGASAAVELALLLGCLEDGIDPAALPPDAQPDPAFGLRWARAAAPSPRVDRVLFHTLGFGGGHSALVLEAQRP